MFSISDKVVCVDDSRSIPDRWARPNEGITKGSIYVVESIDPPSFEGDVWGLQIVGKPIYWVFSRNMIPVMPELTSWRASRFRKLSEVQAENAARQAAEIKA